MDNQEREQRKGRCGDECSQNHEVWPEGGKVK